MLAIRALALFAVWTAGDSVASAQPGQVLPGALEPGDTVCGNLCDRWGLVWDGGGAVRVGLLTNGFGGTLRIIGSGAGRGPGAGTEIRLTARPGEAVAVEVEETTPQGGGQYRLVVEPAPSRFRLPAGPPVPSVAPPRPPSPVPVVRPAPAGPPPDPARQAVEQLMRGFRPSGPLLVGRLEQVPPLQFPAQRGRCYRGVIVLAQGARRRVMGPHSAVPAALVRMTLRTRRGIEAVTETGDSTQRVIALDDLCPAEDGRLEVAFLDRMRADVVSSPGLGPFTLQLFERSTPR